MPIGLVKFVLAMARERLVRKQTAPQSSERLDLVVDAVAKFFGSVYLHGLYKTDAPGSIAVTFKHGTEHTRAIIHQHGLHSNGYIEFSAQALFEDDSFPDAIVEFSAGGKTAEFPLIDLALSARNAWPRPLFHRFIELVEEKRAANGKVAVLDLGGRRGSTARDLPDWSVTVLDIAAAPGVDVVADPHEMSATLGLGSYDHSAFRVGVRTLDHAVESHGRARPGAQDRRHRADPHPPDDRHARNAVGLLRIFGQGLGWVVEPLDGVRDHRHPDGRLHAHHPEGVRSTLCRR